MVHLLSTNVDTLLSSRTQSTDRHYAFHYPSVPMRHYTDDQAGSVLLKSPGCYLKSVISSMTLQSNQIPYATCPPMLILCPPISNNILNCTCDRPADALRYADAPYGKASTAWFSS